MREWLVPAGLFLLAAGLVPFGLSVKQRVAGNRVRANLLEPIGLLLMAAGFLLVTLFVFFVRGWFWIAQAPFLLVTGWVSYLGRVLREMHPDAVAVVSAVACVVVVAVGAHLFLRWLASAHGRVWRLKRTLQLLLLVGTLFAAGVAVTGLVQQTGWLIRTPQPLAKDARSLS